MVRKLLVLAWLVVLQACAASQPRPFMLSDFLSAKELPYDSPPQVIYRIDDHRFVTLEHYRDCRYGETFYNDTQAGIHQKLGRGTIENFQGRLINADPTGMNLAFPSSRPPGTVCGDRGCSVALLYSTDGGRTFYGKAYMKNSPNPFKDSKRHTIIVTKEAIYVSKNFYGETTPRDTGDRYLLIPGFIYDEKNDLPDGKRIGFNVPLPKDINTPSGQDRLSCDDSIRPTNPDARLVP
jgi:hypothetical protein